MENNFVPEVFLSEKFGELRIIEIDDKPYFCGIDVAKALGYSNPRDAIGRHCRVDGVVKHDTINSHKTRNFRSGTESEAEQVITLQYITEGNVYRLIARSKLKEAVQFEKWVFDEIIPTIRKTGGYVNNAEQFVASYFPNSSKEVRAQLVQMLEIVKTQDSVIGAQMPSVEFTRAVVKAGENITIGDFAKVLNKEGVINIGRNKLFAWLRDNGYMMKGNHIPYQRFINDGTFVVQETVYYTGKYPHTARQTLVTPKGQMTLTKKIRAAFGVK